MELPQRKPTRIKCYNYGAPGAYFVTICTQGRRCILSELVSAEVTDNAVGEGLAPPVVRLTPHGTILAEQIHLLPSRFPAVSVDKYVIMPNHLHLILRIRGSAAKPCSTGGASPSPTAPVTIPSVVGALKSMVTRLCQGETKLFQRSFHDHVIRGDADYRRIWEYIDTNPSKWAEDCFYVEPEQVPPLEEAGIPTSKS